MSLFLYEKVLNTICVICTTSVDPWHKLIVIEHSTLLTSIYTSIFSHSPPNTSATSCFRWNASRSERKRKSLIVSVVRGNDAAGVNDARNVSADGKNDGQKKLARASVLPKDSQGWNNPGADQSTTLVAASSGAIGIWSHDETKLKLNWIGSESNNIELGFEKEETEVCEGYIAFRLVNEITLRPYIGNFSCRVYPIELSSEVSHLLDAMLRCEVWNGADRRRC